MALIIDANMPHSCFDCPCLYSEVDGRYFCRHSDGLLYPLYYPMTEGCYILGEIPDRHGRLIDADALEERSYLIKGVDGRIRTVIELCDIEDAPTILEATE